MDLLEGVLFFFNSLDFALLIHVFWTVYLIEYGHTLDNVGILLAKFGLI